MDASNRSFFSESEKIRIRFLTLLIFIFLFWACSSCAQSSDSPSLQESAQQRVTPTVLMKTQRSTSTLAPPTKTATFTQPVLPSRTVTPTDVAERIDQKSLGTVSASNVSGLVQLWKLKSEQKVHDFSFLPDSSGIVIGASGKTRDGQDSKARILIWDLQSGIERHAFAMDTPFLDTLSIDPTGKTVVIGAGILKQMDLTTGEIKSIHLSDEHAADIIQVTYSPAGDKVAMGFALIGTVVTVNSLTGKEMYQAGGWFEPPSKDGSGSANTDIRCLAFRSDGEQLAVCDAPGGVVVLDAATGVDILKIPLGFRAPFSLEYSNDGKSLIIGDSGGRITIWDLKENRARTTLLNPNIDPSYPYTPYTISSSEGDILFSYTENSNIVFVWDIQSEQVRYQFSIVDDVIQQMALSPDGKVLAILGKEVLYFYGVPQ